MSLISLIQKDCESLEVGQSKRITCDCSTSGTSKNLSVTRSSDGWLYHCFKCGAKGLLRSGKKLPRTAVPKAITTTIPIEAGYDPGKWHPLVQGWFLTYLDPVAAALYNFRSEGTRLYNGGGTGFIVRDFDPSYDGPKWVKHGDFKFHRCVRIGSVDQVILVEDVVSAACIAPYADVIALCGTYMDKQTHSYITQHYPKAVVWLDNDNTTVRRNSRKIRNDLSLLMSNVTLITSPGDPKEIKVRNEKEFIRRITC